MVKIDKAAVNFFGYQLCAGERHTPNYSRKSSLTHSYGYLIHLYDSFVILLFFVCSFNVCY